MPHSSESELAANLIVVSQAGSTQAFGRLIKMYQSPLRGFLLKLTRGDHAFADDIAQETFIKAFNKIKQYRCDALFTSWLYTIAYRIFLDVIKRDKHRSHLLEDKMLDENKLDKQHGIDNVQPKFSVSEAQLDIEMALSQLKLAEKTAIILCLQEGMSHTDAANVMNMPIGTVKSHISRGRKQLKLLLNVWATNIEEQT